MTHPSTYKLLLTIDEKNVCIANLEKGVEMLEVKVEEQDSHIGTLYLEEEKREAHIDNLETEVDYLKGELEGEQEQSFDKGYDDGYDEGVIDANNKSECGNMTAAAKKILDEIQESKELYNNFINTDIWFELVKSVGDHPSNRRIPLY